MEIKLLDRFAKMNRPLTDDEDRELSEQISCDGVLEPVVLNQDGVLVDGYNRHRIAGEKDIECPWVVVEFDTLDDAEKWALRKQLGRRNLSATDFRLTLGKLYNSEKKAPQRPKKGGQIDPLNSKPEKTAEKIAKESGVSEKTVKRAGKVATDHDKLCEAGQKLYAAGKLKDKHVAALAKKSKSEQQPLVTQIRKGQQDADFLLNGKPKEPTKREQFTKQKAVAKAYLEKAMRAVDDLNRIKPQADHTEASDEIVSALTRLNRWK